MRRRTFLATIAALPAAARATTYPAVERGTALQFPRDHGAHPAFRTEWWYLTAVVKTAAGRDFGLQVTFFRSRVAGLPTGPSRFATDQIIFAHCALTDIANKKHWFEEKAARPVFDLAGASTADTDVWIDHWRLTRKADGYQADLKAREFSVAFHAEPTRPVLLQGDAGFSQKGRLPEQASYYYSQPQLALTGNITGPQIRERIAGRAWLDHEWSSEILSPDAQGWDWIGINLNDGGALMAFRMRGKSGDALWAAATLADARGAHRTFREADVIFTPRNLWKSPHTQAQYPVTFSLTVGSRAFAVRALVQDQEIQARASTGTVYWEGPCELLERDRVIGRGYLEMTGYAARVRM